MKTNVLALLGFALAACTHIPTPHGPANFWGDYENVTLNDGPVQFHADKMVHSPIVKAHWHGATAIGGEAAGAFIGAQGGTQAIGGAVSVVTSVVNRPTSRATPTPAPATQRPQ